MKILSPFAILRLKILARVFFKTSFSLNNMDRKIVEVLPDEGFYLEIGGNDGVTQSNTYKLMLKGWFGILIEPNRENYKLCKHFRKKDIVINSACTSFDYNSAYVYLSDEDLESRFYTDENPMESYIAPAKTLSSILIETEAPQRIDFFSLDVEGAEIDVLRGVDFKYFSFGAILIEIKGDTLPIQNLLKTHGYILSSKLSHHDYLFLGT